MYKKKGFEWVQKFLDRVYQVERDGQQVEVRLGDYLAAMQPYRKEYRPSDTPDQPQMFLAWYRDLDGEGETGIHVPAAVYYQLDLPECDRETYLRRTEAVNQLSGKTGTLFMTDTFQARRAKDKITLTNRVTGRSVNMTLWQFAELRELLLGMPAGHNLIGVAVTGIRDLTEAEVDDLYGFDGGYGNDLTVFDMSDGSTLFAATDPEMNGPGALRKLKDGEIYAFS